MGLSRNLANLGDTLGGATSNAGATNNTNFGYQTLFGNTTGSQNTAYGYQALYSNTTGGYNIASGWSALYSNTTGNYNIATGTQSLYSNTTGSHNTGYGTFALINNTTGNYNTASGGFALFYNTTGSYNVSNGYQSLFNNTTGSYNVSNGYNVLYSNTIGSYNTANGYQALNNNTTTALTLGTVTGGSGYTNGTYTPVTLVRSSGSTATTYPTATIVVSGGAVTSVTLLTYGSGFRDTTTVLTASAASIGGSGSGFSVPVASITTGSYNTANGVNALINNTTGSYNTALGYNAGGSITTGSKNVIIGSYAGDTAPISATGSNYIVLSDGDANVRMIIDSSGNVGIRTSSVQGLAQVEIKSGTASYPQLMLTQNNASDGWIFNCDGPNGGYLSMVRRASSTSTEQLRINTSGDLYFNSGYGSAATAYGCRAWINYNGTGAAIRASGNITSVTKNGTGDYTINFTTAMPDVNYSAVAFGGSQISSSARIYMENHDNVLRSTTQLRFWSLNAGFAPTDSLIFSAAIFR